MLDSGTLRKRREAMCLTRAQLAKMSGVDATTILRIESGQDPRLKTWRKIELALEKVESGGGGPMI